MLLPCITLYLFITAIITPVVSVNESQTVGSSPSSASVSSSSADSAAAATAGSGTTLRGVTLRGTRPRGQTRRGSAVSTVGDDPLSSSVPGCGPYGELDELAADGVSYAFVRCSNPDYHHAAIPVQTAASIDKPLTPLRQTKEKEANANGPTVLPFFSDFASMSNITYPHKVPLTTVRAHRNVSLVDIPSPLIPHEWNVTTDIGALTVRRVYSDPMVLTLDEFVTPAEIDRIVAVGQEIGFRRSLTTAGLTEARTSQSAYIPDHHPIVKMLGERVSAIVRVPPTHIEFGPILKYEVGQLFDYHFDSGQVETNDRRLTFFVPLSSVVDEDGGATGFPLLSYKFPPKNGTAIIWRNYEPSAEHHDFDKRMKHGGEPPKKGIKYAINMWIYNTPYVHWSLRQAFKNVTQAISNSTSDKANYTLPVSLDQLKPVEPAAQSLLTVRNGDLTAPWVKSLDHGNVTIYPSLSPSISPSFLILRVPDFVPLAERQSLIAAGNAAGWHRDQAVTSSSGRTCSWTWVHQTEQQMKLRHRISRLLTVPVAHIEITFLSRYQVGEHYQPFFDSTLTTVPDRLMTVHMVLHSDLDEDGGELYFPSFPSARYRPLPGLATIWRNYPPSPLVPPDTPRPTIEHDPLSQHGFASPKKGTLYAITAFVFPYPVKMRGESENTDTTPTSGA